MKPRQRRAPLTNEDWAIWLAVNGRAPKVLIGDEWHGLYGLSVLADRRDADLMLSLGSLHVVGSRGAKVFIKQWFCAFGPETMMRTLREGPPPELSYPTAHKRQ